MAQVAEAKSRIDDVITEFSFVLNPGARPTPPPHIPGQGLRGLEILAGGSRSATPTPDDGAVPLDPELEGACACVYVPACVRCSRASRRGKAGQAAFRQGTAAAVVVRSAPRQVTAGAQRLDSLSPVLDLEGWLQARAQVRQMKVADAVLDYVERMIERIRSGGGFCSTRAAKHWLGLAQAEAWLEGRDFITPDDLQQTFADTMAHRGSLDDRRLNRSERREHLAKLLKEISVGWSS